MFGLVCTAMILCQSKPSVPLEVVRTEYALNHDDMMRSIYHQVYIEERWTIDERATTIAFASCNDCVYNIHNFRPGEIRYGDFLSPKLHMKVSYYREKNKSKIYSFVKVNPDTYNLLNVDMRPKSTKYLYELVDGYPFTVKDILEGTSSEPYWIVPHAIRAEEHLVQGERIVRVYFQIKQVRQRIRDFNWYALIGLVLPHGYVDLAPTRSWVMTSGSLTAIKTWTNEFEGTINGIPRLKKVTDRYLSNDKDRPDRVVVYDLLKYEPLTTINAALFEPEYFDSNTSLGDKKPSAALHYMLLGIMACAVALVVGGFLYQQAKKKANTSEGGSNARIT